MKTRYVPSCTFLLHAAAVVLAAIACTASGSTAQFSPAPAATLAHAGAPEEFRLQQPADYKLVLGHASKLPAGSHWRAIGSVAQGTVFRPLNTVVVLESRRAGEAYAVVKAGRLLGFFTPGEGSFSALRNSVPLAL